MLCAIMNLVSGFALGTMCHIYLIGGNTMKVNPRIVKITLDFIAAIAMAVSGVIVKDFLVESVLEPPKVD